MAALVGAAATVGGMDASHSHRSPYHTHTLDPTYEKRSLGRRPRSGHCHLHGRRAPRGNHLCKDRGGMVVAVVVAAGWADPRGQR